jgi:arabinose-5-phosphate isomerase
MTIERENILDIGRNTIAAEIRALTTLQRLLNDKFIEPVECIINCRGRLIITGLGKSGHIARKIAATLTSTGTRAIFLHATEALHGDLGIISSDDVVVALSYSGETEEVIRVADYVVANNITLIAMTGNESSSLAQRAHIIINTHVEDEGSILDIVPTASTTAQLAMGDAMAAALMHANNFHASDFARVHPGGYIEKRIKESNIEQ